MSQPKKVTAQYRAGYTDYDGLSTYRVMPTRNVPIEALDPFIFLNHHGPQDYGQNNRGLPFGPHPHKGFETVTFILEGSIVHADSNGFKSEIKKGGIQWMTAGKGLIHSETSSPAFRKEGGNVEILQLWVNLPAKWKNTEPNYTGLQEEDIPLQTMDGGRVVVHPVSGSWNGEKAPVQSLSNVHLAWMDFAAGSSYTLSVPQDHTVLCYVIRGSLLINGEDAGTHELVTFENEGTEIRIKGREDSILLIGHAQPNREPIVAQGPFVMNTQEEIRQAFVEYQQGLFGEWKEE